MEDKIRAYVESLFAEAVPSRKAVEFKEEMIQNLTEKYHDLLAEGKTPDAAFNIAIAGIGDVSGLIRDLDNDAVDPALLSAGREKTALITAVAVMMYILSVIPLIVLGAFVGTTGAGVLGLVIMFVIVAAATGLLVYNNMSKPRYVKADDTVVEDFRKWQSDTRDQKSIRTSVISAMWALIVAIYFIVSFISGAWYITWVIFIFGAALQAILNILFTVRK